MANAITTLTQLAELFDKSIDHNTPSNEIERTIKANLQNLVSLYQLAQAEKIIKIDIIDKIKELLNQLKPLFNQKNKLSNAYYLALTILTKEFISLLTSGLKEPEEVYIAKSVIKKLLKLISLYEQKENQNAENNNLENPIEERITYIRKKLKPLAHKKSKLADICYQTLITLAILAPLNHQEDNEVIDPLTLCVIEQANRVYTTDGYIFDAPFLFEHISTNHDHRNPISKEDFSPLDIQAIAQIKQALAPIPLEITTNTSFMPIELAFLPAITTIYAFNLPIFESSLTSTFTPQELHAFISTIANFPLPASLSRPRPSYSDFRSELDFLLRNLDTRPSPSIRSLEQARLETNSNENNSAPSMNEINNYLSHLNACFSIGLILIGAWKLNAITMLIGVYIFYNHFFNNGLTSSISLQMVNFMKELLESLNTANPSPSNLGSQAIESMISNVYAPIPSNGIGLSYNSNRNRYQFLNNNPNNAVDDLLNTSPRPSLALTIEDVD